jgi:sec-independent protein translocase protein TatB
MRGSQYHEQMGPSFPDMIFLFLLALIVFGPKKLPEIGRQIGKVLNELKRASNEFKAQIQTEMDHMEQQENARKIMAPSQPPPGAIAALSLGPAPAAPPEAPPADGIIDLEPAAGTGAASDVSTSDLHSRAAPADPVVKVTNA